MNYHDMIRRIAGIITFLINLGLSVFLLGIFFKWLFDENESSSDVSVENILITTIVVIYISSSIVYVLTTRFGSPTHTELNKITEKKKESS